MAVYPNVRLKLREFRVKLDSVPAGPHFFLPFFLPLAKQFRTLGFRGWGSWGYIGLGLQVLSLCFLLDPSLRVQVSCCRGGGGTQDAGCGTRDTGTQDAEALWTQDKARGRRGTVRGVRGAGGCGMWGRGTRSRPSIYLSIKTYKSYIDT